jgi:hypothetical protein
VCARMRIGAGAASSWPREAAWAADLEVRDGAPGAAEAVHQALHRLDQALPSGLHVGFQRVQLRVQLSQQLPDARYHVLGLDGRVIGEGRVLRVTERAPCCGDGPVQGGMRAGRGPTVSSGLEAPDGAAAPSTAAAAVAITLRDCVRPPSLTWRPEIGTSERLRRDTEDRTTTVEREREKLRARDDPRERLADCSIVILCLADATC